MNIYIIRHAIAEDEDPAKNDSERELTEKGAKKMRQIAKGLKKLGVEFDVILSSPYLRTRQTAEILGEVFKIKKQVTFSENLLPSADPDLLITEINEKYSVDTLVLVSHEPFISALISLLTAKSTPVEITLKKGGVCRLTADDLRQARRASFELLITPGILVELSGN